MWLSDPKVAQPRCVLGVGGIRVSFQQFLRDFVLLAMYLTAVYFWVLDRGYSSLIKPKQRCRSCVVFQWLQKHLEAVSKRHSALIYKSTSVSNFVLCLSLRLYFWIILFFFSNGKQDLKKKELECFVTILCADVKGCLPLVSMPQITCSFAFASLPVS